MIYELFRMRTKDQLQQTKIVWKYYLIGVFNFSAYTIIHRRSWAYVLFIVYIENSIQLCKLLINFNQIVCSHHYSTKEIMIIIIIYTNNRNASVCEYFCVCGNTDTCALQYWRWFIICGLKKLRSNDSIQLQSNQGPFQIVLMYVLIGFALYRFEMIKLYALFPLNWSEYTANCLICVIKKIGREEGERRCILFWRMFRFIFICYAKAVYAMGKWCWWNSRAAI